MMLPRSLLVLLLAARLHAGPVEVAPAGRPTPIQQLAVAVRPSDLSALSARMPALMPQLSALVERAHAAVRPASAAPGASVARAAAPSARFVLERAAVELTSVSPEALRAMAPEQLDALAGAIMDGARAAETAEKALPAVPYGGAGRVDQTAPLTLTLASPERARKLFTALAGRRFSRGVDAARFADLATAAYLTRPDAKKAVSTVETRRALESRLGFAAFYWPERTARLAGRRGGETVGAEALGAAQRLQDLPSLAAVAQDPSLADGRDRALLTAIADFEDVLEGASRRELSKTARRELNGLLREARGLRADLAVLKAVEDLSLVSAEGIVRTKFFPLEDQDLPDVADVAVVGGGPAGLSTALHSAHAGLSTVLLEGGYVSQSFSDALMKPVYRMRTPTTRNSIVQAPFSSPELLADLSMPAWLKVYRRRGQAADAALNKRTGKALQGAESAGLATFDPTIPSARNELLQHYSHVADEIVRRGGRLAENARVSGARKRADGLWELTLPNGRVQLARNLVLSQGQVGSAAQNGRVPADIDRVMTLMGHVTLRDRRDLIAKNPELAQIQELERAGRDSGRQLVVHDSLLGTPVLERAIQRLRPGARAVVLGSGESAAKSALAILRLNPDVSVTLLVKEQFAQQQLQVPGHHMQPAAIEQALTSKAAAEKTLEEWKSFGSPITPGSYADLKAAERAGRVRIVALGYKPVFHLASDRAEDPSTALRVRRTRTGTQLYRSGNLVVETFDGPLVVAVGYDRAKLRLDPVTKGLVEQGKLRVSGKSGHKLTENELALGEDRLSCAGDKTLFVVGAQNFGCAQDSAIPGMIARAAKTAERLRSAPLPPARRLELARNRGSWAALLSGWLERLGR